MKTSTMVVLAVLFMIIGLVVWVKAPCGFWAFAPAGEQPTRCLVEQIHDGETSQL